VTTAGICINYGGQVGIWTGCGLIHNSSASKHPIKHAAYYTDHMVLLALAYGARRGSDSGCLLQLSGGE
jgi:hypothetical protein